MTDHTKALAEALDAILQCPYFIDEATVACYGFERTMRESPNQVVGNISIRHVTVRAAREALDAYRASEQPSTAVELPEPFDYCYEWDGPFGTRKFSPNSYNARRPDRSVPLYRAEQLTAYGNARAAEARRVAAPTADEIDTALGDADCALNNEQRAAVHAAIRALITKG